MLSLTVNTSSSLGSMVLGSGRKAVGKIEWHKDKSHSEKITLALADLLKASSINLQDIQLLICGYGPGSFTGLRVGLSVTKTLAYSLNVPIIAVDDCFALALNAHSELAPHPIVVMIDAQKNKVFAGIYKCEGAKLGTIMKPTLLDFSELDQRLTESTYTCVGDGFSSYATFFPSTLTQKLTRVPASDDEPHAEKVFDYVMSHPDQFQKINWPQLSALYLRASAAEEVLADKMSRLK